MFYIKLLVLGLEEYSNLLFISKVTGTPTVTNDFIIFCKEHRISLEKAMVIHQICNLMKSCSLCHLILTLCPALFPSSERTKVIHGMSSTSYKGSTHEHTKVWLSKDVS